MNDSETITSDPESTDVTSTREQELLRKLDLLSPVPSASEWDKTQAMTWWLNEYPPSDTTLEDLHYKEYAEGFSQDISQVELVLYGPEWYSLLCSRTDMGVKFYFWHSNDLFYVGDNWLTVLHSVLYVCHGRDVPNFQGKGFRRIL
jgi:hypothetical protein